jgi:hypothetical protein
MSDSASSGRTRRVGEQLCRRAAKHHGQNGSAAGGRRDPMKGVVVIYRTGKPLYPKR